MRIEKQTPIAPVPPSTVTITLNETEAKKLRRMCYYNKTVSKKYKGNQNGGARKADDLNAFMVSLGESLKNKGIDRY